MSGPECATLPAPNVPPIDANGQTRAATQTLSGGTFEAKRWHIREGVAHFPYLPELGKTGRETYRSRINKEKSATCHPTPHRRPQ